MDDSPSTQVPSRAPSSDDDHDGAEFEHVDWEKVGRRRRGPSLEGLVFVATLLALVGVFLYHRSTGEAFLVLRWNVGWEDWLVLFALVFLLAYVVVPIARSPGRTKRVLVRLRGQWGTVLSLVFLLGVLSVAVWALLQNFQPLVTLVKGSETLDQFQPPVGASVPAGHASDCIGPTTGEGHYEQVCHGTWEYPLGTDRWGHEMTDLLIAGTRPVLYATLLTIGLIVPLATAVGLVAGYSGGLLDDLLMAYVDMQLSVPAILVYLLVYMYLINSAFVFLAAFGLLSWGGIARIVRSETLQRREEGYVLSARAVGASDPYVIRRHIFPNVTNSVVPATFHLIAIIVLTEAGLSFLGFHPFSYSWGETIGDGLQYAPPLDVWWTSALPVTVLTLTVVACKIAGDGFRDILDPRGER